MARIKIGTLTSTGAAVNLNLGFQPSRIIVENYTNYATPTNGEILKAQYYDGMADAYAFIETFDNTGGALGTLSTLATTNGFTPYETKSIAFVTYNEQTGAVIKTTSTARKTVTAITAASSAYVTSTAHELAIGDAVTFDQVVGMVEINRKTGTVTAVADANHFTVDINSSGYTAYASGGFATLISRVRVDTSSIGITLGTSVVGANLDVLYYTAYLDDPIL